MSPIESLLSEGAGESTLAWLQQAHDFGFFGPKPIAVQIRHALDFCRVAAALVEERSVRPTRIVDLGSGGGLPGLVLARAWPDAEVVLVESQGRRSEFLRRAVEDLARFRSGPLEVLADRAEAVARGPLRGTVDVVTARGFGPPAPTLECAAPLLRSTGFCIVSEPPDSAGDRWPAPKLALLGLGPVRVVRSEHSFAAFLRDRAVPDAFPRRVGVPFRRPLF